MPFRSTRTSSSRRGATAAAIVVAVALAIAGKPTPAAHAHPPTILSGAAEKVVAEEVAAFRKALAEAVTRKDAAALKRMIADSFVHTDERGRSEGRDARIAAALAGVPVIEASPASHVVIRVPGGWTAIVTGTTRLDTGSAKRGGVVRWTAVYMRVEDGFQLTASHATRIEAARRH